MLTSDLERELAHVFWLGGSPCAGKSTISGILAGRFGLDVYHLDETFEVRAQSLDPALHPALTRWRDSTWEQRWMQPVERLVREAVACYGEDFNLILTDLRSMPERRPLLVEGTALLPRPVSGVLAERRRAIWVVPTADFQRQHYSEREWVGGVVAQCDNPAAAFDNWMARDAEFARWVAAEVNALGLELLRVDGTRTAEENAAAVASHFELTACAPRA